jgi:hypothetical protein
MDFGLTTLLMIVVPLLIGWLIKSPLGKYVPEPIAEILGRLTPENIQELMQHVGSKEARRESAVEYVQMKLGSYGIMVDRQSAGQIVDYLTKCYKAGYSFVREKI